MAMAITEAAMAKATHENPRHHTQKMQQALRQAMFETSAEVIGGLIKAFRDYEQKNETAWRQSS